MHLRTDGQASAAFNCEQDVLMSKDTELIARVDTLILDSGIEAADALREAAEQTALELSVLLDPMLALRADDVRSVGRRAAAHLKGDALQVSEGVLIADSLGPADVAELAPRVRGIALAGGGVTAHAAIVARSLGLPMVVGVGEGLLEIEDGEEVLVDGDRGVVVRQPDAERASLARTDTERRRSAREIAIARRLEPARTKDGYRIRVLANASTVAELEEATRQGAEGVGLMRTELLFLEAMEWPSHADGRRHDRNTRGGRGGTGDRRSMRLLEHRHQRPDAARAWPRSGAIAQGTCPGSARARPGRGDGASRPRRAHPGRRVRRGGIGREFAADHHRARHRRAQRRRGARGPGEAVGASARFCRLPASI